MKTIKIKVYAYVVENKQIELEKDVKIVYSTIMNVVKNTYPMVIAIAANHWLATKNIAQHV